MKPRIVNIEKNYSFILLGARGTGKSTLIKKIFGRKAALWIDLLDPEMEGLYQATPSLLSEQCESLQPHDWVIIDEVQRVPKLLDTAHALIERKKLYFGFSGSSARKLKRGAANLLAGRAFSYRLFPFSVLELVGEKDDLEPDFQLNHALSWGSLPKTFEFGDNESLIKKYLRSYANLYLKEEIQMEQIVRNLPQFRRFLPIAAQMHTKILNLSKIGREAGCDHSVVSNYFEILEETLLGFKLEGYSQSIRKQQQKSPKFYFIDNGIWRALANQLEIPVAPGTFAYGTAFEGFIVSEVHKILNYRDMDESMSYLRTKDDAEIDLVISRPDGLEIFIEIKSAKTVHAEDLRSLISFTHDDSRKLAFAVSLERQEKRISNVRCVHWMQFLKMLWEDTLSG